MSQIEAIYQDGVFRPLGHVVLPDRQRVRLDFTQGHEKGTSLITADWRPEMSDVPFSCPSTNHGRKESSSLLNTSSPVGS